MESLSITKKDENEEDEKKEKTKMKRTSKKGKRKIAGQVKIRKSGR